MATSGGSGGNTTTGQSSRKMFSNPAIRERLVALCPEAFQDNYRRCLFFGNTPPNFTIFCKTFKTM